MKHKLFFLVLLVAASSAHAATGGAGLPWETPLTTLSNSITGPVAYAVSLIGIVGAGGILIFAGGHVNEFLRAIFFCVLVISFIIAAKNTLTAFGFAAGATISQSTPLRPGDAALSPYAARMIKVKTGEPFSVWQNGVSRVLIYSDSVDGV